MSRGERPPWLPGRLVRNAEADDLLEHFLVAAAAAVLGIRLYLEATGYPQVGGRGLHIAHMLWGGLLMLVALVAAIAFLGQRVRRFAALVGGLGFGTFIDELGKFITSDNNYFFRPTIALIYAVFVLLFLAFQAIDRMRPQLPVAPLIKAIDAIEDAALRGFPRDGRDRALALLARSDPADPLVDALTRAVRRIAPAPEDTPDLPSRLAGAARRWYGRAVKRPGFRRVVVAVVVVQAAATVFNLADEIVRDPAFSLRDPAISFVDGMKAFSSALAAAMAAVGAVLLPRARYAAFVWFKRSLLVSLFLGQFFSFYLAELAAVIGLALNLLFLGVVDYALARERSRTEDGTAGAPEVMGPAQRQAPA